MTVNTVSGLLAKKNSAQQACISKNQIIMLKKNWDGGGAELNDIHVKYQQTVKKLNDLSFKKMLF